METASIVAADSAAALGLIAARLGDDAVLLGVRSHARGVELTAASPRVAPAIARFTAQARMLGFTPASYVGLLAGLTAPLSAADLWVRFVARIERQMSIAPLPARDRGLLLVGPPGAVGSVALDLASLRRAGLIAVDRRNPAPRKPPPPGTVFVVETADIAEAQAVAAAARNACTLVVLADAAADWAAAFATADGAILAENLIEPGAAISALLESELPLSGIVGVDGFAEPRASRLCRGIVVALGRLGAEDTDGERR